MSLKTIAEDYFSQLNPIATRMYVDMNETKSTYEHLWDTFTEDEQKQILSESIIKPEISIKYKPNNDSNAIKEYANKLIIDDTCTYTDEHSGPFSFKTRSQRNLCLFEKKQPETKPAQKPSLFIKQKPQVFVKTSPVECSLNDKKEEIVEIVKRTVEMNDSQSFLPKTGLDFLDNW